MLKVTMALMMTTFALMNASYANDCTLSLVSSRKLRLEQTDVEADKKGYKIVQNEKDSAIELILLTDGSGQIVNSAYLTHKQSGYSHYLDVNYVEERQGYIEENKLNASIHRQMATAKNVSQYNEAKAKLNPSLDIVHPFESAAAMVISKMPNCSDFYGTNN
jgi:hypothetical protein